MKTAAKVSMSLSAGSLVPSQAPALPVSVSVVDPSADATLARAGGRLAAFVALTKPRITVMVLVTAATGFLLGARGSSHPPTLLLTMLGTGLVAGGASTLNQLLERHRDARMRRTANRPLPSGRVTPAEAAIFGTALSVLGLAILAYYANPTSAAVALTTLLLYVFVYTPLKPVTTLNTAIGAIPGALPPVIGWAAGTGRLGVEAWALFLIVFLWQFPHFLAIAWIYRDDYARGGHKMLPSVDPCGRMTGRQSVLHALALLPAGLLPTAVGLAGSLYFVGALALGLFYLTYSARFWADVNDRTARALLRSSFLYLPAVLALLLLNPLPA
ncbi:MAG: heme o synthase [Isosphaeraceae bacterium]